MFHDVPVVAVVAIVITIIIIMRGKTYESVMCLGWWACDPKTSPLPT